jgi:hypothetical protein
MDFAYQLHSHRPYIFDAAGILLIAAVLTYFTYIRYDFPWLLRLSVLLFILGGGPIVYCLWTGYGS